MKAKTLFFTLAAGALAISSCNSGSMTQTTTTLKTAKDSASFYIGYMYGTGLQRTGMKDPNMSAIVAGMNSAIQKKETGADPQAMEMYLNTYLQKLSLEKAEMNKTEGEKFLAENAKKEGIKTLPSGIQYKVTTEGTGVKPLATDRVKVNYTGTLIDGTEFDSSVKRGEPAEFFLNQVIPGWTEAIQQMPIGSKWVIYIPSDLAYGQRGAGQLIEPNSTLIFDVELLDITTPAEEETATK